MLGQSCKLKVLLKKIYRLTILFYKNSGLALQQFRLFPQWFYYNIYRGFLPFFARANKRVFHFGVPDIGGNSGDFILYSMVETSFDKVLGEKQKWITRHVRFGEVTAKEVELINKYGKYLIIGGHGLFMVDTNKNNNSGWQFNITLENLKAIKIPIIIFAIGYNRFRGQEDFSPVFNKHIEVLLSKSIFFGLRNYGSIEAIKRYAPKHLHDKIKFQPCPTTVAAQLFPSRIKSQKIDTPRKIAFCLAFDRQKYRFGGKHSTIFEKLIALMNELKRNKWEVSVVVHLMSDLDNNITNLFNKNGYVIIPLFNKTMDETLDFYAEMDLIVGMRGHSLMIPFGLEVPVISLTTQDKQKWFIETTNHPEWSIEIENENFDKDLAKTINYISDNYSDTKKIIRSKQMDFWEVTKSNIEQIKKLKY